MNNQPNILSSGIVADASVIINLSATGYSQQILSSIPFPVVCTPQVQTEIKKCRLTGRNDQLILSELLDLQVMKVQSLDERAGEIFLDLVSGKTVSSLGDGEASTIAFAQTTNYSAAIDEKKATRICVETYPSVKVISTIDILSCEFVSAVLTKDQLVSAICSALKNARMRVPIRNIEWVRGMIGSDSFAQFPSLFGTVSIV